MTTRRGYEWDCPNCGERISSFAMPPTLDAATDMFAIEYLEKRAIEIAAQAMHRWKHPTVDIARDHCSCRADAEFAVSLVTKPELVIPPVGIPHTGPARPTRPGRCYCGHYHSLSEYQDDAGCSVCSDDHPWAKGPKS